MLLFVFLLRVAPIRAFCARVRLVAERSLSLLSGLSLQQELFKLQICVARGSTLKPRTQLLMPCFDFIGVLREGVGWGKNRFVKNVEKLNDLNLEKISRLVNGVVS